MPLSFGIEFEFFIAYQDEDQHDYFPTDTRPVALAALTAEEAGVTYQNGYEDASERQKIAANVSNRLRGAGLQARPLDYDVDESDASAYEAYHGGDNCNEAMWMVDYDSHEVKDLEDHDYRYKPLEVSSPAFVYSEPALKQVRCALETLTNNYRTYLNTECSVHVHVGQMFSGFSLALTQDICAFLYVAEPMLAQIHPAHRTKANKYCRSIRECSNLEGIVGAANPATLHEAIELIYATTNKDKPTMGALRNPLAVRDNLALLMHKNLEFDTWSLAYQTANLAEPYQHARKRTIEFRQHEGCLDGEAVVAWIDVAVGVVQYVKDLGRDCVMEEMNDMIRREAGEGWQYLDWLEHLGLFRAAAFYRKRDRPVWDATGLIHYPDSHEQVAESPLETDPGHGWRTAVV